MSPKGEQEIQKKALVFKAEAAAAQVERKTNMYHRFYCNILFTFYFFETDIELFCPKFKFLFLLKNLFYFLKCLLFSHCRDGFINMT